MRYYDRSEGIMKDVKAVILIVILLVLVVLVGTS